MKIFTLLEYNATHDREINTFIDDIADRIYDELLTYKNELKKEEYVSFAIPVDVGGKEPAFLHLFVNYQGTKNMAIFVSVPGDMGVIHLYVKTLSGKGNYYDKVVANERHIKLLLHHEITHAIRNIQGKNYVYKTIGSPFAQMNYKKMKKFGERQQKNYLSLPEEWDAFYMTAINNLDKMFAKPKMKKEFEHGFEFFYNKASDVIQSQYPKNFDEKYTKKLRKRLYDYYMTKMYEFDL